MLMHETGIQNLPFQKVQHQVATLDAQPSNEAGGIMVMVTGALLVCSAQPINLWREKGSDTKGWDS